MRIEFDSSKGSLVVVRIGVQDCCPAQSFTSTSRHEQLSEGDNHYTKEARVQMLGDVTV
jgi:hypothetical protein